MQNYKGDFAGIAGNREKAGFGGFGRGFRRVVGSADRAFKSRMNRRIVHASAG
jgi:hypothetical protein